jgi:hypothetical protein
MSFQETRLTYAGSSLDRLSEQRGDAALVESLRANARNFVLAGESFVLAKRGERFDPGLTNDEAASAGEPLEAALLGKDASGRGHFAQAIPASHRRNQSTQAISSSSICARSPCRVLLPPEDLNPRLQQQRRCCSGTSATASAPTAASRQRQRRPVGGAIAWLAAQIIFHAPILA